MKKPILFLMLVFIGLPAQAADKFLDIQSVTSEKGLTAWLVEDHTLPVIAIRFGFRESGSSLENDATQGLAQLLSNTMDEGAGDLTSSQFQKSLLDHSISLGFSSGRDGFGGSLMTLTRHKEEAFTLLSLAMSSPRFDAEPVERMKQANLARIRSAMTDPEWMAARLMNSRGFEGHAYALNSGGTLTTMAKLTPEQLRQFYKTYLTKDRLMISASGDITAGELSVVLDRIFGALPDTAPPAQTADFTIQNMGTLALYKRPIPQTLIEIMMPAFGRTDQDYYALQVMNYIFGGAGFGSRLMEEVREKRGLSYGIYSGIRNYEHTDTLNISVSTKNDTAMQAIDVIRDEMRKLVNEPVSDSELKDAKAYLIGSMPLALSSTNNIANILLSLQDDDLPIDFLDQYADHINAVTAADVQRVAKRLLNEKAMTIVMVGGPKDIENPVIIESLPHVQ